MYQFVVVDFNADGQASECHYAHNPHSTYSEALRAIIALRNARISMNAYLLTRMEIRRDIIPEKVASLSIEEMVA